MIVAALKWVDLRPEVDPLTGATEHDARRHGFSPADEAALEWALRCAERWQDEVLVVTAGPAHAERGLRDALAAGAGKAVRVDLPAAASHRGPTSATVARALAGVVAGAAVICCGDASVDRGSGAVPVHLADELSVAAALGLVRVEIGPHGRLDVERRLDRGRRERLAVTAPAVISVEGPTASLRRASLPAVLAARDAPIEVVAPGPVPAPRGPGAWQVRVGPYRPRPRALPGPDPAAPARDRILQLTGSLSPRQPPRLVTAEPDEAAEAIIAQLQAWGYLEEGER